MIAAWSRTFSQGGEYARPRATGFTLAPVAKTAVRRSPVRVVGRAAALSSSLSPSSACPVLSRSLACCRRWRLPSSCCSIGSACSSGSACSRSASRCADRCAGCSVPVVACCVRRACGRCRYWPPATASFRLGVDWPWGSLVLSVRAMRLTGFPHWTLFAVVDPAGSAGRSAPPAFAGPQVVSPEGLPS